MLLVLVKIYCIYSCYIVIILEVNVYFSSTSTNFVSHTHWLCSTEEEDLWYTSRFDDSSWSNAYVIWNHAAYTDGTLDSFDNRTRLLWHYDLQSDTIFCRGRVFFGGYQHFVGLLFLFSCALFSACIFQILF